MTSPMPIGLTPGFLSSGISRQALNGSRSSWLSFSVDIFCAILACVFDILSDCCHGSLPNFLGVYLVELG